jgi:23S rRNA (pseudouridine1915-N3)-methyltransferase
MFKVKIITIGRSKEAWLNGALAEYEKRLKGRVAFEWLLAEENNALAAFCRKESLLIALDIKGELLSSEVFSEKWMRLGARATFVIGGPDGLPDEVLKLARWRWSLSPLTFTNQIVRLLVVEQIYRALEIAKGSPYHK